MRSRGWLVLMMAVTWGHFTLGARAVEVWLTDPENSVLFARRDRIAQSTPAASTPNAVIQVDSTKKCQPIDGFGYTLTGGSAQHLLGMSQGARNALLRELFEATDTNIGVSYLRLSIGASDLNERVFSYNDLAPGETDPELKRFDLGPDRADVIPVLKEILAIAPELKLMGSPWSPPAWMKTNEDTRGGKLRPEFYGAYAKYFVRYLQAMEGEGIRLDAVTVQNEPLHPGNNPSLLMLAEEQANFIKHHLGPAFRAAGLKTKIVIYDHNADRPDYPITVLNDPEARQYIDGSAFHLYAGKIEALSQVKAAHPDKNLYFTEQWIGAPGNLRGDLGWHTKHLIVGATRNWCRTVLEWNLSSNPQLKPHTDRGGCTRCLGAVTIDGDRVIRNPGYYIVAHASKHVRPGWQRIESREVEGLPNVAFSGPDGSRVLILLNETRAARTVAVQEGEQRFRLVLPAGAVATCKW